MPFELALQYLKQGYGIRRKCWQWKVLNKDAYHWELINNDVLADDWVIVE